MSIKLSLIILLFSINAFAQQGTINRHQQYDSTAHRHINYRRTDNNQPPTSYYQQPKEQVFPLGYGTTHFGKITTGTGIWTEVHPLIPRVDYWGVDFVNVDTGWAVGEGGAIIKTTNSGKKWIWYESGVENTLKTVSSVNGQRVIAAGDGGIILISEDGGESWASIPSGTTENIWNMQMITEQIGWMVGESSTALKTIDGGLTWIQQAVPHTNLAYWDVSFIDTSFGYICANTAIVLKTTNGGDSWQIQQAGDTRSLFTIFAFDTLRASAAGFAGKVVYTTDGGNSWITVSGVSTAEINKIKFINDTTGFMAGEGIYQSTDGGMSWFYRNDLTVSGTVPLTTNLSFPTETDGYITGGEMLLAKTTDKGDSWRRTIVNDNFINVYFKNELSGFINSSQLIYTTNDGGYTLDTLDTFPYDEVYSINAMTFTDSLTGYMGTSSLSIYKTTNSGMNWYRTNITGLTETIGTIRNIFFLNPDLGWAIKENQILKTTDSGENWWLQSELSASLRSIFFLDSLLGWALSSNMVFKTTDSGNNWLQIIDISFVSAWDVYFKNIQNGWVTDFNKLFKTTDGGTNWIQDPNVISFGLANFSWINEKHGFICGGGRIYETIDTGSTWTDITNILGKTIIRLNSPNEIIAFGISNIGLLMNYIDTTIVPVELTNFRAQVNDMKVQLSWETATEKNNFGFEVQRSINKINWEVIGFVNGNGTTTERHNYVFEDDNIERQLYYYRLGQKDFDGSFNFSDIIEVNINSPLQFSLSQNYPNPFNPSTIIKYSIVKKGVVKLIVYDILGREVTVLVNEVKDPGYYEVNFNASNLASGVYIYRLTAGNFVAAKKLLLLK